MSLSANFPTLKPTLLLDFANTKQLDPRITFTRASTATYYDGKTTAMAEQNLLTYSQAFESWTKNDTSVTADSVSAPDGTTTADTITASATTAFHAVVRNVSGLVSGVAYQVSVYAKAGTSSLMQFFSNNGFNATDRVNFDLTGGTVTTASGSYSGATISSVGNGWYRCVIPLTSVSATDSGIYFAITNSTTAARANTWLAAGTETIYLWGAQVEQRSAVTAYTATTSAPITNYIPVLLTAASGVARFDNNPTTGESLGLLIEESRTNLLTYSQTFSSIWTYTTMPKTSNADVAPDGSLTASKFIPTTALTAKNTEFYQIGLTTAGVAYTLTVYAKAAGYDRIALWWPNTGATNTFDLSAGTLINSSGATGSIVSVGNGWYRCTSTYTQPSANGDATRIYIVQPGTTGAAIWTVAADGFSGVYLWGAQLEAGAFATSYIPTVASQVTRSADAASMTGTNFSSWYRADEGTFYAEATTGVGSGNARGIFSAYSDTQNYIGIYNSANGASSYPEIKSANTTQYSRTATASAKLALAYSSSSTNSAVGSVIGTDDTYVMQPSVTTLQIGDTLGSGNYKINGTIKKIAYYPARVTNTQLQALTS